MSDILKISAENDGLFAIEASNPFLDEQPEINTLKQNLPSQALLIDFVHHNTFNVFSIYSFNPDYGRFLESKMESLPIF